MKDHDSLGGIVETKFHDLDVKVTKMATNQEKLKVDVEDKLSDSDGPQILLSSRPIPDLP